MFSNGHVCLTCGLLKICLSSPPRLLLRYRIIKKLKTVLWSRNSKPCHFSIVFHKRAFPQLPLYNTSVHVVTLRPCTTCLVFLYCVLMKLCWFPSLSMMAGQGEERGVMLSPRVPELFGHKPQSNTCRCFCDSMKTKEKFSSL